MPATHSDFKAQVGRAGDAGLRPQDERLEALAPGQNPYVTGTALPANSPVFLGRARQVHEILAALRRPDKPACVSILGERRIGKSSLLNQIYAALGTEPGLVSIQATAQNWDQQSQAQFYAHLGSAISIAVGQPPRGEGADYPRFRNLIGALARDHRFVLILDEFEVMAGNPRFDALFFANLRALAETPEFRFGFLIASREPLNKLCREHRIESSSSGTCSA